MVGTAGSINAFDMVTIDSNYNVVQTASTTTTTSLLGVNGSTGYAASQTSVNVNFCWIATRGDLLTVNTNAATNASAGATLYLGTAPGTIGTASAGTALILFGINNTASVTAATTMAVIAQRIAFS